MDAGSGKRKVACEKIAYTTPECPVYVHRWLHRQVSFSTLAHHGDIEIQVIKHGRGAYLIDGQRFPFGNGTLVCIHPGQIHLLVSEPGVTLERSSLIFRLAWLEPDRPARRSLATIPNLLELTATAMVDMEIVLRRLEAELQAQPLKWKHMVQLMLREFLVLVERSSQRHFADPSAPAQHPVLPEIVGYINAHFTEAVSVETIARRAGFSPSHLSRLFKQYTGLGIKQYILHRRVLEARRWLEESPELRVAAVAEKVGFRDFALFNRAFKAIVRTTPSGYRALVCKRNHGSGT